MIDSGIYESRMAILNNEVTRIGQRSRIIGVDRRYAVLEICNVRSLSGHLSKPVEKERAMVVTGNIEFQRGSELPC